MKFWLPEVWSRWALEVGTFHRERDRYKDLSLATVDGVGFNNPLLDGQRKDEEDLVVSDRNVLLGVSFNKRALIVSIAVPSLSDWLRLREILYSFITPFPFRMAQLDSL